MYDVKFATRGEIMLHKILSHKYDCQRSLVRRKGIFLDLNGHDSTKETIVVLLVYRSRFL